MSLINLPESFLYERLPAGLVDLDERALIQAVVSGYQDRLEDLRAYGKKFQLFFSPVGLPETGPNVVLVDYTTGQGKVVARSLDITSDTPPDSARLLTWAADQLGVDVSTLANPRFAVDSLRLVDANVLDYLATNIGAIFYSSAVADLQPITISDSGTFTGQQLANQQLVSTYFPRLKFKGTPRSFEALGKLMGFDDVRMVPLWGRVSPSLPNDPGATINDPDFKETPEYYAKQDLDPFYDPLNQRDGVYYHWYGTVTNGTAATNYYPQVINGFQPWVKFEVDGWGVSNGTATPATAGTYLLDGGAPHYKASAVIRSTGTLYSLGEGESWNGIDVVVSDLDGTFQRIDITDRLSAIKYRTSFYDLAITMDTDKAEGLFGTLAARANKDIVAAPHAYVSYSGTLYGTSPYRGFTGGDASFQSTDGIQTSDFLTPFAGTVAVYTERFEAGLHDSQENFNDLAKAGQGVTQALEEVRAATRQPRRASYGYLQDDTVQYAPITRHEQIAHATPWSAQITEGTFFAPPLPPYRTGLAVGIGTSLYLSEDTLDNRYPQRVLHTVAVNGVTLTGFTVPSAGSYSIRLQDGSDNDAFAYVEYYGTVSEIYTSYTTGTATLGAYPNTHEVVRPDAFIGTQTFAVIGDYGLAANFGGNNPAQRVADEVHAWNPEIILTVGDNNYYAGAASTIAANNAGYLADIQQGRMFPTLGNHDLDTDGNGSIQASFFFNGTVPGNGRYYNVRRGHVEFFILNSGWASAQIAGATGNAYYTPTTEPDGNTFDSIQGQWLQSALRRSPAPWKVVLVHEPPYASSTSSSNYAPGYPRLRWPFHDWGATIVMSGHIHAYERLLVDGFPYIIQGIGGENNRVFNNAYIDPNSVIRYAISPGPTNYGATKITATESFIRFDTINANGHVVDSYQLDAPDRRYMTRPEDELDDDQRFETLDEYPYRRDILIGGELIETDYWTAGTNVEQYSLLGQTMAVKDQTQVDFDLYVAIGQFSVPQYVVRPRPQPYVPGQRSIAFSGQFRDQSSLGPDDLDFTTLPGGRTKYFHSDLDNVFQPGYRLYHAGLVNAVPLADPDKFNGDHHLRGLRGWLPFDEHPESNLTVRDATMSLAYQSLVNVAPTDRLWDAEQGFSLQLMPGAKVASTAIRDCKDDLSFSFWFKPTTPFGDFNTDTLLEFGNVQVFIYWATQPQIYARAYIDGIGWQAINGLGHVAPIGAWTFVTFRKQATQAWVGFGNLTTPVVEQTFDAGAASQAFSSNDGADTLFIDGFAAATYQVRDFRIWNVCKTPGEFDTVRNYQPQQTVVPYRVGYVLSVNAHDRYGLQVLPNGWLTPSMMPAWVRTPKYAKVVRYASDGEYNGEPYRKEVGLGGGQLLPNPWKLGEQFYSMTANGTVAIAPQLGAMPGSNAVWQNDTGPGSYIVLNGSNSQGSLAVVTSSGSGANPWPNRMEATNPIQESIWLENGTQLYECKLKATGLGFNNIDATFSQLVWAMPVSTMSSASTQPADQVITPSGYGEFTVTLRIRGLVETKGYNPYASPSVAIIPGTGGYAGIYGGALNSYTDGALVFHPAPDGLIIPSRNFNEYLLIVSNPPNVYALNASTIDSLGIVVLDYNVDIQVAAGATVTLRARDVEGFSIPNLASLSIVPGVGDPPLVLAQPYAGQWMQMDVVAITGGHLTTTFPTAEFATTSVFQSNQQQGDAGAFLATPGTHLVVNASGSVAQALYAGTVTTPPLFMYLNETLLESVSGQDTLDRWTDPTRFGLQVGAPVLKEAGELAFTNNSTLLPGTYKLKVDLGNLGQPDDEFDGFRLDITVADTTFSETLLQSFSGNNLRGQQEITFTFDHSVSGDWILTFAWLNPYIDKSRGVARQLVIYGYELRRLETNLYQVDIAPSGTLPLLTHMGIVGADYLTTPGGWLVSVNGYGTIYATTHEGTVYPENDTLRSRYPLANLLTAVTPERREDILSAGTFCLPDGTIPPINLEFLPNLTGVVSDSLTALPIPGATVVFTDSLAVTSVTVTDGSGVYDFEFLPLGSSTVSASHSGYSPASASPTIAPGTNVQNLVLIPFTSLSGHVRDSISLAAISGATVVVVDSGATVFNLTTDANGFYSVPSLLPGLASVTVSKSGYTTQILNPTMAAGPNVLDVLLVSNYVTVSGVVSPLGSATITGLGSYLSGSVVTLTAIPGSFGVVGYVDVVFIVDESGSMVNEHFWLGTPIQPGASDLIIGNVYKVIPATGSPGVGITYNGTHYADGATFTAVTGHLSYIQPAGTPKSLVQLRDLVPIMMEAALAAVSIGTGPNPNQYGLVGFGASNPTPHQLLVNGGYFGTAPQMVLASAGLTTGGGTEDGYSGMHFATGYAFRSGAVKVFILITDEGRDDITGNTVTMASIIADLTAAQFKSPNQVLLLAECLNCIIKGSGGQVAVGRLSSPLGLTTGAQPGHLQNGTAVLPDGVGGFTTTTMPTALWTLAGSSYYYNTVYLKDGSNVGGKKSLQQYAEISEIIPAAGPGAGSIWDLNQLRLGGFPAQSFTAGFIDAIKNQISYTLNFSFDHWTIPGSPTFVNGTSPTSNPVQFIVVSNTSVTLYMV